ncbi:AEC family transporter [Marinobacter salarius]|uniref:AEC family transporter n=1 Tax=Marinobacter salarius TaxID=1420917 RepID=UPI00273AEBD4|nr:AEC family transporter [Marinobacter salarius]MDP4533524.1 AEC family transporter [Marinobacter salarius]
MITQILETLLPVFLIAGCGAGYSFFRPTDIRTINVINVDLFVPLLVFSVLADQKVPLQEYTHLAIAGSVIVLGSGILLLPVCRAFKLNVKTFIPPMMFNNSGNMGIPLVVLAFGDSALPAIVVLFIVEMVLHFSIGIHILAPSTSIWQRLKIPVVLAAIAGFFVNLTGIYLPNWFLESSTMLGNISVPLMLFTLGVRMLDIDLSSWKVGLLGAVACPASGIILAIPFFVWLDLPEMQMACLWVFAALPPAVLNYMVAEKYNQEPNNVASLVLIGNLGSLLVMPVVFGVTFNAGYS